MASRGLHGWAFRVGARFAQRYPNLNAVLTMLLFLAIGVAAGLAAFADTALATSDGLWIAVGALLGVGMCWAAYDGTLDESRLPSWTFGATSALFTLAAILAIGGPDGGIRLTADIVIVVMAIGGIVSVPAAAMLRRRDPATAERRTQRGLSFVSDRTRVRKR